MKYFEDWLQSIENRPGTFTKHAKGNMFLSYQTYEGIKISTHSIIELVQYLIRQGVPYVLTERLSQDPLEVSQFIIKTLASVSKQLCSRNVPTHG